MTDRKLDDWIERYLEFSQNTESPKQYHLWTAISAIASCLQRRTWLSWGHEIIYPNFYIVLVGPPGGRKGTAMKILKPFIQDLGIIMSADSIGSVQSLYMEIKDSLNSYKDPNNDTMTEHRSLSTWSEEFQVFLGDNDPKLIMAVTDLFDSPKKWEYKSIKQGKVDLSNCWFNLLGAITPTLLQTKLSKDAMGGGLVSRTIFVVGYGQEKLIPLGFLTDEERELELLLRADLEQINQLVGPFKPTQRFINSYSDWYGTRCYHNNIDNEKFMGYNSRRALHMRKLCMVVSASESNSMLLNERHLTKAIELLEYTEQYMPDAFYGVGKGLHGEVMGNVINILKRNKMMEWTELVSTFHLDMLPGELGACMDSLELTGHVKKSTSATKTMYEFADKEQKEEILLNDSVFKHVR